MQILPDSLSHINLDFLDDYSPDSHDIFESRLQKLYDDEFNRFCSSEYFVCPHCGKRLRVHDSFNRTYDFGFASFILKGRRTYCPHCGKSDRFLPAFTIPRSRTASCAADKAIRALNSGRSLSEAIALSCADPYSIRRIISLLRRLFPFSFSSFSSFLDIFADAVPACCSRFVRAVKKINGVELFKMVC